MARAAASIQAPAMRLATTLALVSILSLAACGPAPGYADEPDEAKAAPEVLPEQRRADENPNCRMATPQTRLLGRMGGFRGVEGMNTLLCPPTPVIEPPPPGSR